MKVIIEIKAIAEGKDKAKAPGKNNLAIMN